MSLRMSRFILCMTCLAGLACTVLPCFHGGAGWIQRWAQAEGLTWIEGPEEIRTSQAFFDAVDGAAQPIIDLGWKRSVLGTLAAGKALEGVSLRLTVHEMAGRRAAEALFRRSLFEGTESVPLGDRGIYWDQGAYGKGILFQKGALVCELSFEGNGDRQALLRWALGLVHRIP